MFDTIRSKSKWCQTVKILTHQHLCTAKCFCAETASVHWLGEPTLPTVTPANSKGLVIHDKYKLVENRRPGTKSDTTKLTAALATAKLASLETAFTSPSDLMMRLILAKGSTWHALRHSNIALLHQAGIYAVVCTSPEESLSVSLSTACCKIGSVSTGSCVPAPICSAICWATCGCSV